MKNCPRIAALNEHIDRLEAHAESLSGGMSQVEEQELGARGLTIIAEEGWERGQITHEEYVRATTFGRYLLDRVTDEDDPTSLINLVMRNEQLASHTRAAAATARSGRDALISLCRFTTADDRKRRAKNAVCHLDCL